MAQWAAKSFPDAVFASYDMIRPGDSFGKMMITNLKVRRKIYHLLRFSCGAKSKDQPKSAYITKYIFGWIDPRGFHDDDFPVFILTGTRSPDTKLFSLSRR